MKMNGMAGLWWVWEPLYRDTASRSMWMGATAAMPAINIQSLNDHSYVNKQILKMLPKIKSNINDTTRGVSPSLNEKIHLITVKLKYLSES